MVVGAWILGFLCATGNVLPLLNLNFCSNNIIRHYNCELPSLLALSCAETVTNYIVLLIFVLMFGFSSFLFTLISYIHIISTMLKIKSTEGRQKLFSTCSSHLVVVGLFYITVLVRYMKPSSESYYSIQYFNTHVKSNHIQPKKQRDQFWCKINYL